MRLNYLANAIGLIMIYIGIVVLAPIPIGLYYHETHSILPFLTSGLIGIIGGYSLRKFIPDASRVENINDIKKSEALFVVAVSWIIVRILSAVPYMF